MNVKLQYDGKVASKYMSWEGLNASGLSRTSPKYISYRSRNFDPAN